MNGEEIKKTNIMKLVERLFIIDSKLTGETAQLVKEYNEIIEEIWYRLEGLESKSDPPKILSLKQGGNIK